MGDPEDYSIAREGVWGREGAGIARGPRAGGFFFRKCVCAFACFLRLFWFLFCCRDFCWFWAALGSLLGRSWGGLGGSWGVLGGGLGRSLAIVGSK